MRKLDILAAVPLVVGGLDLVGLGAPYQVAQQSIPQRWSRSASPTTA